MDKKKLEFGSDWITVILTLVFFFIAPAIFAFGITYGIRLGMGW